MARSWRSGPRKQRWQEHIQTTLFRPVLLVDEAQERNAVCLNEIRLLGSARFDSQCLLTTLLCGDTRLPERFRASSLVALGSRIRFRMSLQPYAKEVLADYLDHIPDRAGGTHLMSAALKTTLVTHAAGNLRLFNNMAAELLAEAADREASQLDEKLFLELYSRTLASARPPRQRKVS